MASTEKERSGGFDDDKFASPWRREGPLPDRGGFSGRGPSSRYDDAPERDRGERMGFGSRFVPSTDGPRGGPRNMEPPGPTEAETNSDWRAGARARPPPPPTPDRGGPLTRKGSGFGTGTGEGTHAADTEESWSKGSKFVASEPAPGPAPQKGGFFNRREPSSNEEPSDWRSAPRRGPQPPPNGRTTSYDRSRE